MNDLKEPMLLTTTATERKQNELDLLTFHSEPGAKHIPEATGGWSEDCHGVIMMLEVSLETMPIWHEKKKANS